MSAIISKIQCVDPNNGDAIKEALAPFFQDLPKHTEVECVRWLRTLQDVINRFPKYCMSQRLNIENYLIHFLDSANFFIVIEAAKSAHVLQQVRPSQEKTATAKTQWREQVSYLCQSAHALIGALFPQAVDIYQQNDILQKDDSNSPLVIALLQLHSVPTKRLNNNTLSKETLLSNRLRNVFVFLQSMLVEIYPVAKPVRPQTILDVIVRALSVSSSANQNLFNVCMVKIQALKSLDALVACLGPNLIPFSPLVFRFVIQTLKWSSDNPSEQSSQVRCAAYSSLSQWLSTLQVRPGSRDRGKCWEDELTDNIIEDITPYKHVVQLTMTNQPTKNLSKKAKRRLANTMLQESVIASHMPGEKHKVSVSEKPNDELIIAALNCAETFLTVCGTFLKPTIHKRFQERLVRECYAAESYNRDRALALVRALESTRKATPHNVPPPTQYCLQLYNMLINSNDREISNFCSRALLDIRMHLHCSPQSLNFAVDVQTNPTEEEEPKKKISDRNRAALEALLGVDKVPKETEEVSVVDGPSNKKRKVDESDRISVSSESVNSVEDTDQSDEEDGKVQEVEIVIESIPSDDTQDDEVTTVPVVEEPDQIIADEAFNVIDDRETQSLNENSSIEENYIYTKATQIHPTDVHQSSECKVESVQSVNPSIFEAMTQIPLNVSHDYEERPPLSMEVAYDYPNTGTEKVTLLEKLEGDNLPSSNETDDIQITCGQMVKNSQDVDLDKKNEIETNKGNKLNGVAVLPEKPTHNGVISENNVNSNKDVTVEDMLADFVDEVNEDSQATVLT